MSGPTTALGNWYGTVLFWRPQVALLVNEETLYPVLMRLAPGATLMERFPEALGRTMGAHGVDGEFIKAETARDERGPVREDGESKRARNNERVQVSGRG